MKIYFLGAISGRYKYEDNYKQIIRRLKKFRHEVKFDHILEREPGHPEKYPELDDRKYVESVKKEILNSDLVFAEVSHFTANMGYEISYAIENGIPVIAYCVEEENQKVSPFLQGNTSPLFVFRRYKIDKLGDYMKDDMVYMINLANKQFTFTVTPDIKSYLDWNFNTRKVSRGLFIRLLIESAMKEDSAFAEFLKPNSNHD